ncbi:MAG: shikimate dehydrogenase [Porticoccaceae bacterium]|nr:shikimate dehydrogenase [Porticoccaceae bacterium]
MIRDKYAVFGNPIAHSRSPLIHSKFASNTGQSIEYAAHLIDVDRFSDSVDEFFLSGGHGLNVTVPFKLEASSYVDQRTHRAFLAGSVNTLWRNAKGGTCGDNTDGVGLLNDLKHNLGWPLKGLRVLVLGAGGAVRGVLGPLLWEQPSKVVVVNRTVVKAQTLIPIFSTLGPITFGSYEGLEGQSFDLVINGTSASLTGQKLSLPSSILARESRCYDMVYSKKPTEFMCWGASLGAKMSDGLGMLVEQAAESFFLWRGVRPETKSVINTIRSKL